MAKFWENLKKHPDTIEKHVITAEEIQFLKGIQNELNTQDHLGQADPRYWVIRNYKKVYGENLCNPDGISIYDDCNATQVMEVEYQFFGIDGVVEKILNTFKEEEYDLDKESIENLKLAYNLESLVEAINDIEEYDFRVCEYEEIPDDEGMFLTHDAAIQHLKENEHHYSENAHTYAKTAWRSREEKLWNILQTVDFDKLLYEVPGVIEEAPLIEAATVVHGEWIEGFDGCETAYECSICHTPYMLLYGTPEDNGYNFCPNCGADMRKGE